MSKDISLAIKSLTGRIKDDRLTSYSGLSDSSPALLAGLDQVVADKEQWLNELDELYDTARGLTDPVATKVFVLLIWEAASDQLRDYLAIQAEGLSLAGSQFRSEFAYAMGRLVRPLIDRIRELQIDWPELDLELAPELSEAVWTVRIEPLAYLRAVWNLFWSAILHPLSETTIDLSTGRVLYHT